MGLEDGLCSCTVEDCTGEEWGPRKDRVVPVAGQGVVSTGVNDSICTCTAGGFVGDD